MPQTIKITIADKHSKSDTAILWCSDPRLRGRVLETFVELGNFGKYDLICIPGGAKSLADSTTLTAELIKMIKTLRSLHGFNTVVLTMHQDCGACGGSKALGENWTEESAKLLEKLDIAKQKVLSSVSNINIVRAIVGFQEVKILD